MVASRGRVIVSENIYSNPSGFTNIPWEFSLEYFTALAISAIQKREVLLDSQQSTVFIAPLKRECPSCGADIDEKLTFCPVCSRASSPASGTPQPERKPVKLLHEADYELLTCDPSELERKDQHELVRIHNVLVDNLRRGCSSLVEAGGPSVKVREGLVVPREWDAHYSNLWPEQPKCLIWMAARHAVLGNPLAGEVFEWNNQGAAATKVNTGGKVAGAAALGILAGFLFS